MTPDTPTPAEPLQSAEIERVAFEVLRRYNDDRLWRALTYESGPYDVTMPGLALTQLAQAFFDLGAKRAATQPATHVALREAMTDLEQVVAFLDGSAKLEGSWYGQPSKHNAQFWWRINLRESMQKLRAALATQAAFSSSNTSNTLGDALRPGLSVADAPTIPIAAWDVQRASEVNWGWSIPRPKEGD